MAFSKRFATLVLATLLALPFAARAEDAPGTFKIPGTDTTLKLYGYAQLDLTMDFRGRDPNVEGDDWAHVGALVPLDKVAQEHNKKPQLYLTARTSRFGIQTATPTRAGDVGVRFEGDFNGANIESGQSFTNSVLFRLRHAYGTIGGSYGTFLIGQTWTTFLDLGSVADTVDFNGPGTIALVRQPMIKYVSPSLGGGVTVAFAAENSPGTDGNDFSGASGIKGYQPYPDFVASLNAGGNWGSFTLAGVTMNYSLASAVPGGSSISKQGYGLSASGAFKLMGDTLVAHAQGGSGIGRYLFGAIANPRFVVSGNDLSLTDALAYHVGYTHVWGPQFRSNLVGAQTFIAPNSADTAANRAGANHRIDELFVNTFWTFAKNAEFGLEYLVSQAHTFGSAATGSQTGTQSRVTSTFHYNFF
jgi:hypothetical protein